MANAIIEPTERGTYALKVDGKVLHEAPSRALCGMWGARKGYYQGVTPRRAKPTIPAEIEDESIKKIKLLAEMSGESYPRFLAEAKAGTYGELYQLGKNSLGLKYGNWKRAMAARVVK